VAPSSKQTTLAGLSDALAYCFLPAAYRAAKEKATHVVSSLLFPSCGVC
jgi:hypothetical protein